jgi:hypothetical protein
MTTPEKDAKNLQSSPGEFAEDRKGTPSIQVSAPETPRKAFPGYEAYEERMGKSFLTARKRFPWL